MEAGQELDRLIAVEVMKEHPMFTNLLDKVIAIYKPYSTDISAAWEVMEKMQENFEFTIQSSSLGRGEKKGEGMVEFFEYSAGGGYCYHHGTLPHAICLAALKAKGIELK